jgi:hypothetical protein
MFTVDLHAHTRFFHANEGEPTPFDPLGTRLLQRFAARHGLDAVATTNHDYYRPAARSRPVPTVPGIEVTTTEGDVLVVGPDPPSRTDPGTLTPAEVVDVAHDRDCAAILAHPFRGSTVAESGAALDAVEINGKHPNRRAAVERLAADLDLPVVGGSDAHFPFEVGRAHTAVDAADPTPAGIVQAIRDGSVEPRVVDTTMNRLVQRAYAVVHEMKERT